MVVLDEFVSDMKSWKLMHEKELISYAINFEYYRAKKDLSSLINMNELNSEIQWNT